MNVLVVDDDPAMLESLDIVLTEFENCAVTVANSAENALRIITSVNAVFDCLLLDIDMPKTDGPELLRCIREIPGYAGVPAIMATALGDRARMEHALAHGAFDHITKPFDFFELRSRMNAVSLLIQQRGVSSEMLGGNLGARVVKSQPKKTSGRLFDQVLTEMYGNSTYLNRR